MKRAFISFGFTGVSKKDRDLGLAGSISSLQKNGIDWFCSNEWEHYFNSSERKMDAKAIYKVCLKKQETCDRVLFFFISEQESSGMQQELALAKELHLPVETVFAEGCGVQEWMLPFLEYEQEMPAEYILLAA